ncbi:MAG: hypothetical protein LT105_12760 [Lentimicrobium sp.]|nr:hypothetical protein [Lentimicrobium sp.]
MSRLLVTLSGLLILVMASCNNQTVKKELYEDGKVKTEKTYEEVNGEEQLVKEVVYHPNGSKYIEGNYKDGLREGYWASWFDNGTLWSEGDFKNGESHGKRTVYHPNGNLYYEGFFNMGKRVGKWYFYNDQGQKVNEIDYDLSPEVKE